jgi:hypothetical protein
MLAVCGGGGSDVAAWALVVGALLVWVVGTVSIVRRARDKRERWLLITLLVVSIVLGPALLTAFYEGFFGDDGSVVKLILVLLIPGAIGAGIARWTQAGRGLWAFLASTWGALFLGGAYTVLLVAFLAVGTGCIGD